MAAAAEEKLEWRGPFYGGATIEPIAMVGHEDDASEDKTKKTSSKKTVRMKKKETGRQSEKSQKVRGDELMRAGRYEEACEAYALGVRDEPRSAVLLSNRCAALLKCGRHETALSESRRLIELAPGWSKAYGRLVAALHASGDFENAEKEANAALELFRGDDALTQAVERARRAGIAPRTVFVTYEKRTLKIQLKQRKTCRDLVSRIVGNFNVGEDDVFLESSDGEYVPLAMRIDDVVQDGTHLLLRKWASATETTTTTTKTKRKEGERRPETDFASAGRIALHFSNWDAAIDAARRCDDSEILLQALAGKRDWEGVLLEAARLGVSTDDETYAKAASYTRRDTKVTVEEDFQHPIARELLAQRLLEDGHEREAMNQASIALGLTTSKSALLTRAKAAMSLGKHQQALDDLLEFIDYHPGFGTEFAEAKRLAADLGKRGLKSGRRRGDKFDWTGNRWREWTNVPSPSKETGRDKPDADKPDRDEDRAKKDTHENVVDYYSVLGIPRFTSDVKAIRRAYRAKALLLHPDKNPSAPPDQFHLLNQAFLVLTSTEASVKSDYDANLGVS